MAQIYISAAHKSSGKTTLSIGLCAALRRLGEAVRPFKKGPDYIDPMWLGLASGTDCYNLDFNTDDAPGLVTSFVRRVGGSGLGLVEGNKGLHDGMALDGSDSNAALARLLNAPVILVVDTRGMTRGVAALLLGFQRFDSEVRIAGVVFNQVGGGRHAKKLRDAVEAYTDIPVLGAVQRSADMAIVERHLGLVPSNEAAAAREKVEAIADQVAAQVDLDAVRVIARASGLPRGPARLSATSRDVGRGADVRIGIARDAAFGFYYADDLALMEAAGAELVKFDTLKDTALPAVDGLFIGGGFPETHLKALQANVAMRMEIRRVVEKGMPVYAECGGLMYLTRRLSWRGRASEMVGALPADTVMHDRPMGRGYIRLRETSGHPWVAALGEHAGREFRAHEFHYSTLENMDPESVFAYDMLRGAGLDGFHDGIVHGNVLASYAHLRNQAANRWPERFIAFVRAKRADTGRR